MARRKSGGKSSYTYFKKLFAENPQWLDEKSNDNILARYREDHGLAADAEVDKKVKNNLANLKSNTRKKIREASEGGKAKVSARKSAAASAPAIAASSASSTSSLGILEEAIDDCLTSAKGLDPEGLADVIAHLRRARNLVVWKIGQ